MAKITAAEVSKLRKITGAGMMDCKKALVEAEGDFDKAQEIIRERGQAIANKRSDREATEGAYIHMGNKIGTIVATNKTADSEVVRNVAMQVAAMNPIAVDESSVSQEVKDKEFEIGRQQALNEGKPEAIVDKIATGKVGKFMKENTLLNQAFVRDNKVTIKQYLQQQEKDLTVVEFRRWALAE
jgi:elongation factor Ts